MTNAVTEREAEVAAKLAAWDALPADQRAPVAFRDLLAWMQANYVSVALGLISANAEIERLYQAHPEERPVGE